MSRRPHLLFFRTRPRRTLIRLERCLVNLERALPPDAAEARLHCQRACHVFHELKAQLGEMQELPPMRRDVEAALRTMLQGLADVNVRRSMWFVCPICLKKWVELARAACELAS